MSKYGHYTQQYFSSVEFPKESFTISGISFYQENCKNINYNAELKMFHESDNCFDSTAIAIYKDNNKIGYVPNNQSIKELCNKHINEPLFVINIKTIKNITGIRVIPKQYFTPQIVENSFLF